MESHIIIIRQTTAFNNLYSENQATVGFITAKVWDKMIDQTLVIVGPMDCVFTIKMGPEVIPISL